MNPKYKINQILVFKELSWGYRPVKITRIDLDISVFGSTYVYNIERLNKDNKVINYPHIPENHLADLCYTLSEYRKFKLQKLNESSLY